ncbi:MAG: bifunctional diaminohydroxyphosphoribosylaminopyrimidine deaminase/5-amino-6-(5-phosphoribosylamino)uracil reductase RibD [Desulfarculaceae bacterium]|nr:bifunctional diaminohydroxyphosphoribosylaminopyrimidine deaminase/5-amino-6-(5-phosphoribosylamino)uracil reductase RibD [Desulfarculaceae bacterium]
MTTTDEQYMERAAALAEKGRGFASPNPAVGALVVADNRVVGIGWHKAAGLDHAEVMALQDAGKRAKYATLYVTLEPCNHQGRTPPCTRAVIEAGIRRVVVGSRDPNPGVCGGGIETLQAAGVEVTTGVLRERTRELIEEFIWYAGTRTPFVTVKCAATLDGRIATATGDSKWITNKQSRRYVHRLRHEADAILVGGGTVQADNPSLTARIEGMQTKDPIRVILDSRLSIDENARLLNQISDAPTLIVTAGDRYVSMEKKERLEKKTGVSIVDSGDGSARIDIALLMKILGDKGVNSLFVEGGAGVIGSFFHHNIVNKALFFKAPKILGGDDGVPVCRGRGGAAMDEALDLEHVKVSRFGDDVLIRGYVKGMMPEVPSCSPA